jgi:hypothetical protein
VLAQSNTVDQLAAVGSLFWQWKEDLTPDDYDTCCQSMFEWAYRHKLYVWMLLFRVQLDQASFSPQLETFVLNLLSTNSDSHATYLHVCLLSQNDDMVDKAVTDIQALDRVNDILPILLAKCGRVHDLNTTLLQSVMPTLLTPHTNPRMHAQQSRLVVQVLVELFANDMAAIALPYCCTFLGMPPIALQGFSMRSILAHKHMVLLEKWNSVPHAVYEWNWKQDDDVLACLLE